LMYEAWPPASLHQKYLLPDMRMPDSKLV